MIGEDKVGRAGLTRAQILEKCVLICVRQLGYDGATITENASIDDDLQADSLDRVEIVLSAEEEFDIAIADSDAEKASTVGDLITIIQRQLAAKSDILPI